jgi:photosystem II stability/assembly factor-like uncharacterized protein
VSAAPSTYAWSCFAAIDENTAWALFYKASTGSTGGVYKTTDGGGTWSQQGAGSIFNTAGASFPDVIYFWDANTGVAIGDPVNNEYEIYTTTDGGTTWTAVSGANIPDPSSSGEFGLTRSFAVRGNSLWFGTNAGRLFKTTDFGATWTVYSTGTTLAIVSLDFANETEGWAELSDPTSFVFNSIVRTTDGGNTWTDITPSGTFYNASSNGGFSYVPFTANTLVASGVDDASASFGSAYSLDGGDSWIEIDNGVVHTAVSFYDNETGWSGGLNTSTTLGGIFKYTEVFQATGIPTGNSPNYEFNLYPNPSNGLFYISFDAENNLPINVQVTDAMGKIVFQKIYKDKSQLWLRSIDLRDFNSGVYFMKLENDGVETTQKLVIQ